MYKATEKKYNGKRLYCRYLKDGTKKTGFYLKKKNKMTGNFEYKNVMIYSKKKVSPKKGGGKYRETRKKRFKQSRRMTTLKKEFKEREEKRTKHKIFTILHDWVSKVHNDYDMNIPGGIDTPKFKNMLRENLINVDKKKMQLVSLATLLVYQLQNRKKYNEIKHHRTRDYLLKYGLENVYETAELLANVMIQLLGCSYDKCKSELSKYTGKRKIGVGSYGIVYKVTKDDKEYVLKYVDIDNIDDLESIYIEIESLKKLSYKGKCSQYVSCLYDIICVLPLRIYDKAKVVYVLEYVPGEELSRIFDAGSEAYSKYFSNNPYNVAEFFLKLSFGLKYIHDNNIAHFDIKENNIKLYLNEYGEPTPKYIDFGLSCTPDVCHFIGYWYGKKTLSSDKRAPFKPFLDPLLEKYNNTDTTFEQVLAVDIYALGRLFELMLYHMGVQDNTGLEYIAHMMRVQNLELRPTINQVITQLTQIKKNIRGRDFGPPKSTKTIHMPNTAGSFILAKSTRTVQTKPKSASAKLQIYKTPKESTKSNSSIYSYNYKSSTNTDESSS